MISRILDWIEKRAMPLLLAQIFICIVILLAALFQLWS